MTSTAAFSPYSIRISQFAIMETAARYFLNSTMKCRTPVQIGNFYIAPDKNSFSYEGMNFSEPYVRAFMSGTSFRDVAYMLVDMKIKNNTFKAPDFVEHALTLWANHVNQAEQDDVIVCDNSNGTSICIAGQVFMTFELDANLTTKSIKSIEYTYLGLNFVWNMDGSYTYC